MAPAPPSKAFRNNLKTLLMLLEIWTRISPPPIETGQGVAEDPLARTRMSAV
jgi:hypothetical protein